MNNTPNHEWKRAWLLIVILVLFVGVSAGLVFRNQEAPAAYYLLGFAVALLALVYAVVVLGFKVTGKSVSIERAREELAATKRELDESIGAVARLGAFLGIRAEEYGDLEPELLEVLERRLEELAQEGTGELLEVTRADVRGAMARASKRQEAMKEGRLD